MYYLIDIRKNTPNMIITHPKQLFEQFKKKLEPYFVISHKYYTKSQFKWTYGVALGLIPKNLPGKLASTEENKILIKNLIGNNPKLIIEIYSTKKLR